MATTVIENGEYYAALHEYEEAEKYADDLRKRHPYTKFDLRESTDDEEVLGRWGGEDKIVWAAAVCWDEVKKKCTSMYRQHVWEREIDDAKSIRATKVELIHWFYVAETDETRAMRYVTKARLQS